MPVVTAALSDAPLGVGVLGCADIAQRRFLPAAARCDMVRVAAVAGRDRERTSAVARHYVCTATDYAGLLRSDRVDLVYIPLPNHLHEEWAIKAADHGKHVLCEKPLGLTHGSVKRMVDAAERNGVLLYENLMYLQHPQHRLIREMAAGGRIGTVTGLHCVFTIPDLLPGNFRLDPGRGGGAFHDLNRYPLSAARFFLRGDIDDIIRCDAVRREGMVVSMEAEARTTRNELFSFTIAFGQPYRSFYEVRGTGGTLRLERGFTPPADHSCRLEIGDEQGSETVLMPPCDHFLLTIEHVVRIIRGRSYAGVHGEWLVLAETADRFLHAAGHGGKS